ncbi:DUF4876 domain-containing protein [Labilibacter marinus]|uniref:DUF4876 domain-containing protein n=1 Tax=Labilibacter marinus TaxID=1477105 RepID=UPI0009502B54|nr:DUF4876 domain-containing protein [Labilibacter marinus]
MRSCFRLVSLFLLIILLVNCDDKIAKAHKVNIQVQYNNNITGSGLEMLNVNAVGVDNKINKTNSTDESGTTTFKLPSGLYNFSVSFVKNGYNYNGYIENQVVKEDGDSFTIDLTESLQQGLVFKEIYYSGSRTPEGKTYTSDQFLEIYNNTDEVIYLDGLTIGSLQQAASNENDWINSANKILNRIALQWHVMYILGSGYDVSLQPFTSVVIAVDGINHKSDPNGNPNSPVDLGNANWEAYCGDFNGGKDLDAVGVPNLELLFSTRHSANDWTISPNGNNSIIMFKLPQISDYPTWGENPNNRSTEPGSSSSTEFLMIPKEYVIDAVELVRPDDGKQHKSLHNDIDAGKVWCTSSFSGKSIRRKVKEIVDGNVIYQDTNNSSNDFLSDQDPTPGIHPTSVD